MRLYEPDGELLNIAQLERGAARGSAIPLPWLRARLSSMPMAVLDNRYKQNLPITDIVKGRAWVIDQLLRVVWNSQEWPKPDEISLVAVGGYGRGELLPSLRH